jgi:hypothetical protein
MRTETGPFSDPKIWQFRMRLFFFFNYEATCSKSKEHAEALSVLEAELAALKT